jgi:hypothetical protein
MSAGKTPWYVPTPAKVLLALLLLQGFLITSANFQWFAFNREKGYSVLLAIAVTLLTLLLMAGWLMVSRFFRNKAQFSLATLLLTVPVIAIPSAWFARELQIARRQKELVAELRAKSYDVQYSKTLPDEVFPAIRWSGLPQFLVAHLGEEFFADPDDLAHYGRHPPLEVLGRLASLKRLWLITVHIGDDELARLAGLTQLRELVLDRSLHDSPGITDQGMAHLKGLMELEDLELGHTRVTDAGLDSLTSCKRLKHLYFDSSQITNVGVAKLGSRHPLESLKLKSSLVTDAGLEALKPLTGLNSLWLDETKIGDAGLAHLKGHTELVCLQLSGTKITDAGLTHLAGLKKLRYLSLERTAVTDAGLEYLRDLNELDSLDLSQTAITDAGVRKILGCSKLKRLYLHKTDATDATLKRLQSLPNLNWLSIFGTKVTKEGVLRFQQACPQCEVLHVY